MFQDFIVVLKGCEVLFFNKGGVKELYTVFLRTLCKFSGLGQLVVSYPKP